MPRIKKLWEVLETVSFRHRIPHEGYPLRMEEFGGGFIYVMPDGSSRSGRRRLDYRDPMLTRTWLSALQASRSWQVCSGGQMVVRREALPEGGWHTIPKGMPMGADAGDAGGF